MEYVSAGELLAARDHLLTTDDADVVDLFQLLYSGVRIAVSNGEGRDKNVNCTSG